MYTKQDIELFYDSKDLIELNFDLLDAYPNFAFESMGYLFGRHMKSEEIQSPEESISVMIGKRLGIAMKALGETKSSLARKTGLSEATIRGYLKGSSTAGVEQLVKISRATGIRAAWFLGEQDDMYGENHSVEEELTLLSLLFRHLSGVQRQIVISQVLTALAGQYSDSYDASDIRKLSSPIIATALKISELSDEQRTELEVKLRTKISD